MTDLPSIQDLPTTLAHLSGCEALPSRARKTAARLLQRLTSPVQVGVFGPGGDDIAAALSGAVCPPMADIAFRRIPDIEATSDFQEIDMGLWCTWQFEQAEEAQWSLSPDVLKDHSFIVGLHQGAADPAWQDDMQAVAQDMFVGFEPVQVEGDGLDLTPLANRIAQRVDAGREADQDHAALFAQTHHAHVPSQTPPTPKQRCRDTLDAVPIARAEPHESFAKALGHLQDSARKLSTVPVQDEKDTCRSVLEICAETAETLTGVISTDRSQTPDNRALVEDILTAADEVILMSLEETIGSATDAVTVLLQIRKDLCQRVAA